MSLSTQFVFSLHVWQVYRRGTCWRSWRMSMSPPQITMSSNSAIFWKVIVRVIISPYRSAGTYGSCMYISQWWDMYICKWMYVICMHMRIWTYCMLYVTCMYTSMWYVCLDICMLYVICMYTTFVICMYVVCDMHLHAYVICVPWHSYHMRVYMHITYNIHTYHIRMCMHITYIHSLTYISHTLTYIHITYVHTYIHTHTHVNRMHCNRMRTHIHTLARSTTSCTRPVCSCASEGGNKSRAQSPFKRWRSCWTS